MGRIRADRLLDERSSTEPFRVLLADESRAPTSAGNNFRIGHSEQGKTELSADELDYMFVRCYAFLWHVLRT